MQPLKTLLMCLKLVYFDHYSASSYGRANPVDRNGVHRRLSFGEVDFPPLPRSATAPLTQGSTYEAQSSVSQPLRRASTQPLNPEATAYVHDPWRSLSGGDPALKAWLAAHQKDSLTSAAARRSWQNDMQKLLRRGSAPITTGAADAHQQPIGHGRPAQAVFSGSASITNSVPEPTVKAPRRSSMGVVGKRSRFSINFVNSGGKPGQ